VVNVVKGIRPPEACLVNEIELINTAHADPEVRAGETRTDAVQWWRQEEEVLGRKLKEEARQSRQYSKCHSLRSTTSARPWGCHA